jgi:hypothetical protein
MALETKHCNGCGEDKELSEFNIIKSGRMEGKPHTPCRECSNANAKKRYHLNSDKMIKQACIYQKLHPEKSREANRKSSYRRGVRPASENKSSSQYLGCVVAETVLSNEFLGFKRMLNCNPGYDYDCPKGFKIDVKSSCRRHPLNSHECWTFRINKNSVADYFLCIAFDNRKSLTPEHIWLIPGDVVNGKFILCITDLTNSLAKWVQYERSLDNVIKCCKKLKGEV